MDFVRRNAMVLVLFGAILLVTAQQASMPKKIKRTHICATPTLPDQHMGSSSFLKLSKKGSWKLSQLVPASSVCGTQRP